MNSDKENPNNHAPAVSPDDDWDGLEENQVFNAQLPPRRSDAPKSHRTDLNSSSFKTIEINRSVSVASAGGSANANSLVSMNIKTDRLGVVKNSFQAAHVMNEVTLVEQNHQSSENYDRPASAERNDLGMKRHKGSFRWMIYTALGMILLISLTVFLSQFGDKKTVRKSKKSNVTQLEPVKATGVSIEELGVLGQIAKSNKEAREIFGLYAQAESANDFSKYMYLKDRNEELAKDAWQSLGAKSGWKPVDRIGWKVYQADSLVYAELRGVNHDFSNFLAFFRYENSVLKMDWKATTGFGTASFDELKSGAGDGSEIRGWISTTDFFTQLLPEKRYHSFVVKSPENDVSLWAYTEIGSEVDKNISALFAISPVTGEYLPEARVTLSLERGDQEILPSQWMIKSLIADNWLDQATP